MFPNGVVAVVTATISPSAATVPIGIANALGATQSGGADPLTATGGTITALPLALMSLSCNPDYADLRREHHLYSNPNSGRPIRRQHGLDLQQ